MLGLVACYGFSFSQSLLVEFGVWTIWYGSVDYFCTGSIILSATKKETSCASMGFHNFFCWDLLNYFSKLPMISFSRAFNFIILFSIVSNFETLWNLKNEFTLPFFKNNFDLKNKSNTCALAFFWMHRNWSVLWSPWFLTSSHAQTWINLDSESFLSDTVLKNGLNFNHHQLRLQLLLAMCWFSDTICWRMSSQDTKRCGSYDFYHIGVN